MKKITGLAMLALSVTCMLCGCSFGGKEAKKNAVIKAASEAAYRAVGEKYHRTDDVITGTEVVIAGSPVPFGGTVTDNCYVNLKSSDGREYTAYCLYENGSYVVYDDYQYEEVCAAVEAEYGFSGYENFSCAYNVVSGHNAMLTEYFDGDLSGISDLFVVLWYVNTDISTMDYPGLDYTILNYDSLQSYNDWHAENIRGMLTWGNPGVTACKTSDEYREFVRYEYGDYLFISTSEPVVCDNPDFDPKAYGDISLLSPPVKVEAEEDYIVYFKPSAEVYEKVCNKAMYAYGTDGRNPAGCEGGYLYAQLKKSDRNLVFYVAE